MRVTGILFFASLFIMSATAHPLHLSITNITYENGKLKISMKTFRDDWETAYFHYHSMPIDFTSRENREIPWFEQYLNDRFRISADDFTSDLTLTMDTIVLNEESMIIEIESYLPTKPNSLYIYNALLTDIYPDQTNLVIFGFKKRETGIKFDVKKHEAEVLLK
jgi:hypothetical protein